jgi:4-amino-4-deoxy-L-arabinose transferase-like glycosyltransferase
MKDWYRAHRSWVLPALLILAVYSPFLGARLLRMTGDEKVYISQAIEMQNHGTWFVQYMHGRTDYFKGPLHYLLVRFGLLVFGWSAWAALYMNLIFLLAGALSLAAIVRRRLPAWRDGDIWVSLAFALGIGIYTHTWASQMEIEVAGLACVALYGLDRAALGSGAFVFWLAAGFAGWAKSPLHSVLLGLSGVLFWATQGELLARLRSSKAWLGVFCGVLLCVAGYFPAFFLNQESFWREFIIKENVGKGGTGLPWHIAVVPLFTYFLVPWLPMVLVSLARIAFAPTRVTADPGARRLLWLSICGLLPNMVFFIAHPYRYENYNLPLIGTVWLATAAAWGTAALKPREAGARRWMSAYAASFAIMAITTLVALIAFTYFILRMTPAASAKSWWPAWGLPFLWLFGGASVVGWTVFGVLERGRRPHLVGASGAALMIGVAGMIWLLGEREMAGIRGYLDTKPDAHISYVNLTGSIWNEWGYLGLWIGRPVTEVYKKEQVLEAIKRGDTLVVADKHDGIDAFEELRRTDLAGVPLKMIAWKRWRTRGLAPSGESLWQEAWNRRDISLLETDYYLVETR